MLFCKINDRNDKKRERERKRETVREGREKDLMMNILDKKRTEMCIIITTMILYLCTVDRRRWTMKL